jgi:tetratricopeptide (TPR) repeat protein
VSGPVDDPIKAIESLRKRIMGALAVSLDERISAPIDLGKPPTYEAYREFLEGQRASARREDRKAIKHYSRAIELDPDFIMAAIQRAYAYLRLREYAELELIVRKLDKSHVAAAIMKPRTILAFKWQWQEGNQKNILGVLF